MFDKKSAKYCFERSHAILCKPFSVNSPTESSVTSRTSNLSGYDKNTKKLIGENLLDIENTLKALNSDFFHTYNNELDKAESTETLFGDNSHLYSYDQGNVNSKTGNPVQMQKYAYDLNFGDKKKVPMALPLSGPTYSSNTSIFQPDSALGTSKESSSISRRNSQKSNSSPQELSYSPRESSKLSNHGYVNLKNEMQYPRLASQEAADQSLIQSVKKFMNSSTLSETLRKYPNLPASAGPYRRYNDESMFGNPTSRQRSMSFTEKCSLGSPILPDHGQKLCFQDDPQTQSVVLSGCQSSSSRRGGYKLKSIKARTLRRLSYNPTVLDTSSSSNSESEFEQSMAHSECDIRTKVMTNRRKKQNNNRKTANPTNVECGTTNPDKLYGSNASIRSAPQYSYISDHNNYTKNTTVTYSQIENPSYPPPFNGSSSVIESNNSSVAASKRTGLKPQEVLGFHYAEFDISKLTGKSPTSQQFFNSPQLPKTAPTTSSAQNVAFQWPDKIHGAQVKQNDLFWQRQQKLTADKKEEVHAIYSGESDSASSITTNSLDFGGDDYLAPSRMPPSPAP